MQILSVLLKITPNLATRATRIIPLNSPKGTMWYLFDPTPSGWCKTDAYSMDSLDPDGANRERTRLRTTKCRNDILMFQQNQGESPSEAWTRFKDLLQKVPHHGLDLWLQFQIFYEHVDYTTQMAIDYAAGGRLRKLRPEVAWETIKYLARYKEEGWNDPVIPEEGSLDYENPDLDSY
ncbi:hypothetical protein Tco_0830319 [Tanacetum coccineum]